DLSDVPASPSVRRLAREMDVDITKVEGTGPGNRISQEDVKQYAGESEAAPAEKAETKAIELPDFSQWGATSRESLTTIRKITSKNVQQSWQTIPHVTQFDEADITELENFRKKYQSKAEKAGGKLTVTAILLKIAGFALQKFPRFNASIDSQNEELVYKHYYNVGIAADTPKGLLVPVVRDVNSKSLIDLSVELTELAQKARDKKISPDEMQGGNFTISNLGGIGGTAFTPIVLPPQVAILGVARSAYKPVYVNGELEKRLIIPLSLSYDHRVIDGADGARFLRWICDVIEDPYAILQ
ncbi:MAG TPA: 2-oxo acid dehydrogenase subunit E2, partial [Tangfeifania sp.]|nr:2-oxo acid dehydrogenase subunit E2 [Tangfeifania sp.]